jgi:hypothetical protein
VKGGLQLDGSAKVNWEGGGMQLAGVAHFEEGETLGVLGLGNLGDWLKLS